MLRPDGAGPFAGLRYGDMGVAIAGSISLLRRNLRRNRSKKAYVLIKVREFADLAFGFFQTGGTVRFDAPKPAILSIYIPNDISLYGLIDYTPQISPADSIAKLRDNELTGGRGGRV